jgi:hypothetical protein
MSDKGVPPAVSAHLDPEEEVLFSKKQGFFRGAKHFVITNRRFFELEQGSVQEYEVLASDEQAEAAQEGYWAVHQVSDGILTAYHATGNIFLVTNQRVLLICGFDVLGELFRTTGGKVVQWELPLSDVRYVGIGVGASQKPVLAKVILYTSETPEQQGWDPDYLYSYFDVLGPGTLHSTNPEQRDERPQLEAVPRRISALTGLPFCPPEVCRISEEESRKLPKPLRSGKHVEFYIKTDLHWPQRCAACEEPEGCEPGKLKVGTHPFWDVGFDSFTLSPPFCPECKHGWRWKDGIQSHYAFNGLVVTLWFKNEAYAVDFVELNSEIPEL